MTAPDAPDHQRHRALPQKLLLAAVSGTPPTTVVLPTGTQTLVVVCEGGAGSPTVTVTGALTGIPYPGTQLHDGTHAGSSVQYHFNVAQSIDASVTVAVMGGGNPAWWVYADSAHHIVTDLGPVANVNPCTGCGIVRKFPFAYNTANLLTGATIYTPTVGDVLLDVWVQIVTQFNGTTPLIDVGTFISLQHKGWWGQSTIAGAPNGCILGAFQDSNTDGYTNRGVYSNNFFSLSGGVTYSNPNLQALNAAGAYASTPAGLATRVVPGIFVAADPIQVVCTQNGENNGADPVNTAGTGIVYLITATPQ
jgi:hypothetical protein